MLSDNLLHELAEIKDKISKSGYWPKSLSGACNVSSIIVQSILDKHGIDSYIVNNHKHAFNILPIDGVSYVLDLTACQISQKAFPEDVLVRTWTEMNTSANNIPKGKGFYSLEAKEGFFYAEGGLTDILKVNTNFNNDDFCLHGILERVCKLSDLEIDTRIEITPDKVNSFALEVIKEMTINQEKYPLLKSA